MAFFSRLFKFRIFKFRTTLAEELDDLHTESNRLQQSISRKRLLQRTWTRWFAIYAILFYLSANLIYYTLFLPNDYVTQIYALGISIASGTLFYVVHTLLRWYFRKSLQIKEERLTVFKERRQELIEEVKNKETYAVAKSLLEKYGETITTPDFRPPVTNGTSKGNSVKLNGNSAEKPAVSIVSSPSPVVLDHQAQTPVRGGPTRLAAGVTPGKLPRAILPPQRTVWGTILDTIVGDGPSKRYALICKSCNSHNGMALEEEFEYLSFRCAYCNYFNGARKQKPVFNPDVFHSSNERRETPVVTDSSDSTEETRLTRRSIRIPPPPPPAPAAKATNGSRSRSPSTSGDQRMSNLSSSEENLSKERKTK